MAREVTRDVRVSCAAQLVFIDHLEDCALSIAWKSALAMLMPQPQRPLARSGRFSACIDATSPKTAELIVVDILSGDVGLRDVLDIKAVIALLLARKALVYLNFLYVCRLAGLTSAAVARSPSAYSRWRPHRRCEAS